MEFMIISYGYDAAEEIRGIRTMEEAKKFLNSMACKWLNLHGFNEDDDNVTFEEDFFMGIVEGKYLVAYKILEVPTFKTKSERLLFDAKINLELASFAAEDYKVSLCDNNVDTYLDKANQLIDQASSCIDSQVCVETPDGFLVVTKQGTKDEYPGVSIYRSNDGKSLDELVTSVEFNTFSNMLRTYTYTPGSYEPTAIIRFEDGKDELAV